MECPKSCCGLLSLQVGVVVIAATLFTIAVFLLNLTILDYYASKGFPWALIIVIIFLVLIIGVAVTALVAAYFEHRTMILCSLGIMSLSFLYWLIFVILTWSLATKTIPEFCIGTRCAISLWLVPLHFKDFPERSFHSGEYDDLTTTTEPGEPAHDNSTVKEDSGGGKNTSKREISFNFWNFPDDQKHVGSNKTKPAITRLLKENINKTKPNFVKEFYFISDDEETEEIRSQNKVGKIIAAVYLVVITFVYYIVCMVILYSYSVQLKEEALEEEEFELIAAPIPPRKK